MIVRSITFTEARLLIEAGHYLGHLRKSGVQIGLFDGDDLVGAAVYGQPSREGVVKALWAQGDLTNTMELLRFYTLDDYGEWGTWFLSRSVRALDRCVEMLVAFSDPAHGHFGGLYQAASWLFTGETTNTPYHYENANGERIGKQTPWKQARRERDTDRAPINETPAEGERRVARERGWIRVKDARKLRYVYPRTRRARQALKQASLPYPAPNPERKRKAMA